jgi:hypothetical protein
LEKAKADKVSGKLCARRLTLNSVGSHSACKVGDVETAKLFTKQRGPRRG